jgi:DNA-binding transcriptional LysR family regulator
MAAPEDFDGLHTFLAVARSPGFRAAARELGLTAGAVSQAIRRLEERLGVPLFIRTTRSVALTDAGVRLAKRLAPLQTGVADALEEARSVQSRPTGTLRLCVRRLAVSPFLETVLPRYRAAYPEVSLEVEVRDGPFDLVKEGFDAGIRIGEFIEPDMIAVRIGDPLRWIVVGSQSYLARQGTPQHPKELEDHACIGFRFGAAAAPYRWEFRQNGREIKISPNADIVVTDSGLLCALAARGVGLAYTSDAVAREGLADGRLVSLLLPFMPPPDSLYLYFPAGGRSQPKLRGLIDIAKDEHTAQRGRRRHQNVRSRPQ